MRYRWIMAACTFMLAVGLPWSAAATQGMSAAGEENREPCYAAGIQVFLDSLGRAEEEAAFAPAEAAEAEKQPGQGGTEDSGNSEDPANTGNQGDPAGQANTGNQEDPAGQANTGNQGDPAGQTNTGNQGDPAGQANTGNQGNPAEQTNTGNQEDPAKQASTGNQDNPAKQATPEPPGDPENEYADLAIANVSNYVNVRSAPSTDGEIVGKIYDGAVAQILSVSGEEQDWFQVVSGDVEGYIKAEFFYYGDAAAAVIDDYVTRYATVRADRLNVRRQPDIGSPREGYLDRGEKVKILEDQGEWLKVQYTDSNAGYVAAQYVTVSEEFVYAKTLEEEEREQAEKRALEERQRVSEEQAAENTAVAAAPPDIIGSTGGELRQQIVDYAMQYLGNKYVHGGRTLAGGTDCSGFTSLIYKEFGYSISRTPSGQLSGAGRSIEYSQIQPGDIICYGSEKCTHVALYIGDGQIIHEANSKKGVVIGEADYDNILGVKNVID